MTTWRPATAIAAVALLASACGGGPADSADAAGQTDTEAVSGTIEIDGSSTVAPLTDAIAEEYSFEQSAVTVNLSVSGTGGGFERFCGAADTDISNASRPIKPEEAERCAEQGVEFIEVRVGTDALTMVTSTETEGVECLTTEQVAAIFGPDGVGTWNEVDASFPDQPLTIFAPGTDSGTYDFMVEDVLDIETARQDYQASEDDNIIVQGVRGTPGAWGFFGFAFFQENADSLKVLGYDAGEGCVLPSVETAQDDSYAMSRPLFIYVKTSALQEKPHVADFVRFYLDNVSAVIESVGYIPAPEDVIADAKAKVDDNLG